MRQVSDTQLTDSATDSLAAPGTVLVTGGAGFIGSHLVDALVAQKNRVFVIDNLETASTEYLNDAAEFIETDICDAGLAAVIEKINPSAVYHLAAQGSVAVSAKDPSFDVQVNVNGSINLLEAVRGLNTSPRFIYFSTGGAIYGDVAIDSLPASENMIAEPLSPYGASKLAVENYLRVYGHLYGVDYGIVRPANVYGPRQNPHGEAGVIAIFSQAMLEGREVTIFGDGEDERDYIYISDFIDGVMAIARSGLAGPYNIGMGIGVSVNEIYAHLAKLVPTDAPAKYGPPRAGDIRKIWLDVDAARRDLDWRATTSFEQGLRLTVDWFRQAAN